MTQSSDRRRRGRLVAAAAGVVLAAASALPSGAGAAAPACSLSVTAEPATLTMGRDRKARVRIVTAGGEPQLAASVGRVENVQGHGGGVFFADYVPPRQGYPQVAVLAARDGDACGWTAIRLVGVGEAVVRARPHAEINVRIAGRTFGPVTADRDGKAVVPVEVPPGVRYAYHGEQEIELGLPAYRHLAALADPTSVRADVESVVDVLLVASSDDGTPRPGVRMSWKPSQGVLSVPEPAGPGTFRARWTIPAGKAEPATLSAALEGEEPIAMTVKRLAGPPAALEIGADRARVVAGEPAPLAVEIRLRDSQGNAADGEVQLAPSLVWAGPVERVAPGAYRSSVAVPPQFGQREALVLVARAGGVEARTSVALSPADVERLVVEPAGPVEADGRNSTDVCVELTDRYGNRAPGAAPTASAGSGEVGPPRADGAGRYLLAYRPYESFQDASDEVHVAAGPLAQTLPIQLLAPMAHLVLSPHAGMVLPVGGRPGLNVGVELGGWKRMWGQQLGLTLDVSWAGLSGSDSVVVPAGTIALDGSVGYLSVLVSGAWRRGLGQRSMIWMSAGAGVVRASSTVTVAGQPAVPESGWAPAVSAAVAWGLRLWGGFPFLELRATWQGDPNLASLRGGYVPLSLNVGYRLGLL
jgi:hypothetical protein